MRARRRGYDTVTCAPSSKERGAKTVITSPIAVHIVPFDAELCVVAAAPCTVLRANGGPRRAGDGSVDQSGAVAPSLADGDCVVAKLAFRMSRTEQARDISEHRHIVSRNFTKGQAPICD